MDQYASGIRNSVVSSKYINCINILSLKNYIPKSLISIRVIFLLIKYLISPFIVLFHARRYNIVHIVDQSYCFLILLKYVLYSTKFICTVHDIIPLLSHKEKNFNPSLLYKISIYLSSFADYIVFPSKFTAETYNEIVRSKKNFQSVCRHDIQIHREIKLETKNIYFPNFYEELKIGFIAGEFYKRNKFCLDICKVLSKEYALKIYILGDYEEQISKSLIDLHVANFEFKNKLSLNEIIDYYQNLDLFLFPSIVEGLGAPLIEALRLNCPVFASSIPVFKEITENKYILYDCSNPDEIFEFIKLVKIQRNNLISQSCRNALNKYCWKNFKLEYEKIILTL